MNKRYYFLYLIWSSCLCAMELELADPFANFSLDESGPANSAAAPAEDEASGLDESLYDEGWRLRESLALSYRTNGGELKTYDFRPVHKRMAKQEQEVYDFELEDLEEGRRNLALVRYSLIGERQSSKEYPDIEQVVCENLTFKFPELGQADVLFASGKWAPGGSRVSDGSHVQSGQYRIITAQELELRELQGRLQRWNCDDSCLEYTGFHRQIESDLRKVKSLIAEIEKKPEHLNMSTVREGTFEPIRKDLQTLESSYLDSEQTIIEYLRDTWVQDQFRGKIATIIKNEHLERILGLVVHLHTRLSPCERCAPIMFRECERPDGVMKSLQALIAREQHGEYPFGILLVSCREFHKRRGPEFTGIDTLYRSSLMAMKKSKDDEEHSVEEYMLQHSTDVDRMSPFYPLVFLDDAARDQMVRASEKHLPCKDPETLNRYRVIRFCREHGGLDPWIHTLGKRISLAPHSEFL